MMVVVMPVVNDDDLLCAGAVPAGLAFARLYLRANSAPLPRISPLVWPPAASRWTSPRQRDGTLDVPRCAGDSSRRFDSSAQLPQSSLIISGLSYKTAFKSEL